MQPKQIRFSHFLEYFPIIELPIRLGEDTHTLFSQQNEPLPIMAIQQFLIPLEEENEEEEDLIEYIPCFRIPKTKDFNAIVYWKAALLSYQYILVTYDLKGKLIAKKVIAGTYASGKMMTTSAATIEEDWTIYVVSGFLEDVEETYDAAKSTAIDLELLPDGSIINAI